MATAYDLVSSAYESIGRGAGDAEGVAFWTNALETGQISPEQFQQTFLSAAAGVTAPEYQQAANTARDLMSVGNPLPAPMPVDNSSFLAGQFQTQLGREPTADEVAYYSNQINTGRINQSQITHALNQSLEGQNYDTQYLTSVYRQMFGRNPDQEGFQYWLSQAQNDPQMTGDVVRSWIGAAAQGVDPVKYADVMLKQERAMQMASLEADPYGGRYATTSIYETPSDAVNLSQIGGKNVQFVSPVTQRPLVSQFNEGQFASQAGLDVLSAPNVNAAIQRAIASGTMDQTDYNNLYNDLRAARSMDDVYTALNKPQGQVVVDALYGFQVGEGKTLEQAQTEAGVRTPYIQQFGYYPSNMAVADVLEKAGVDYAFGPGAYAGYDTMMRQANVVTPQNFNRQMGNLINQIYGQANFVPTEITPGYYSERGFEPTFTPLGTAPTFRSGVAGYIPPSEVPRGFEFGVTPAMVPLQQFVPNPSFTPGTFNANATSYDALGNPVFGETANLMAQNEGYLGNPVIGYAADGSPIYSTNPAPTASSA